MDICKKTYKHRHAHEDKQKKQKKQHRLYIERDKYTHYFFDCTL